MPILSQPSHIRSPLRDLARLCLLILSAIAVTGLAGAEEASAVAGLPLGASSVLPLYPAASGSESSTRREIVSPPPGGSADDRMVRDVVHPTLVVFRPLNTKRATHTAVIVAPGGGFLWLSIESEGYDVARALAAEGVTAIVLKYRLQHTPEGGPHLAAQLQKQLFAVLPRYQGLNPPLSPKTNPAVADGIAAVRYVREHAVQLGVDPSRIGMVGFSAGGVVTEGTLLHGGPESRLAFAGLIYGAFKGDVRWPPTTPPLFLAVAIDDFTGATAGTLSAFDSLRSQHHSVELHVFENAGHGFGMQRHGLTADLWFKEFVAWMAANGFLT